MPKTRGASAGEAAKPEAPAASPRSQPQPERQGAAEEPAGQGIPGEAFRNRKLPESVLEEGRIIFFFSPKVGHEVTERVEDVQRFHILLEPFSLNEEARPKAVKKATKKRAPPTKEGPAGNKKARKENEGGEGEQEEAAGGEEEAEEVKEQEEEEEEVHEEHPRLGARLITIPKKRLPNPKEADTFYGFVSAVGDSVIKLTSGMGEKVSHTKTRGDRVRHAMRAVASGVYVLCHKAWEPKSRPGTLLAWSLELPLEPGPCQEELVIEPEGSVTLMIKNPTEKDYLVSQDAGRHYQPPHSTRAGSSSKGGEGSATPRQEAHPSQAEEGKKEVPPPRITPPANAPHAGPRPEYSGEEMELFASRRGTGGSTGGGIRWLGDIDAYMLDFQGTEMLVIGDTMGLDTDKPDQAAAKKELEELRRVHMQAAEAMAQDRSHVARLAVKEGEGDPVKEALLNELVDAMGGEEAVACDLGPLETGEWEAGESGA